jgi:ACS family tartrate transporter-like MFS transporter
VTSLLIIPAVIGIVGSLLNAWHSDKTCERCWHTAVPLLAAGFMYGLAIVTSHNIPAAISALLLGSGFLYAYYQVFWSIPTMILSESAAAASFGLITSISQIGGFAGPYAVGLLNEKTHTVIAGFGFIALAYIAGRSLILRVRVVNPVATGTEVSGSVAEGEAAT